MRADIHGGPEHDTLQYEAGYIDARPTSNRSTKTSCDARPDHTSGPQGNLAADLRDVRSPAQKRMRFISAVTFGTICERGLRGKCREEDPIERLRSLGNSATRRGKLLPTSVSPLKRRHKVSASGTAIYAAYCLQ